jgi:translation initiation factor 1
MKNSFSSLSDLASALGHDVPAQKTADEKSVNNDLVYSTEHGRIKPKQKTSSPTQSDGFARVRRETKGRKGKGVVVISGLGITSAELKALASKLKKSCGAGGSVVDETIEVQGDKREAIKAVLEKLGYKVKFTGG